MADQQSYDARGNPIGAAPTPAAPAAPVHYDARGNPITEAAPAAEPSMLRKLIAYANVAGSLIPGAGPHVVQSELNMLPAAGGTVGAAIGGVGGTVAGMGVGGVPGAVGGAALGGGAGEAVRQLASRALGMEAPATAGEAAADIGEQGAIQGGAELAGAGVGAGMKKAAPWLMQKAVKPAKTILDQYRTTGPKVAQTLLDEGINVTPGGVAKLQELIGQTNDQIATAVQNAPGTIPKKNIAAYALPTAANVAKDVNPVQGLKDVGSSVEEFMNHPVYTGPDLTPAEVQELKVGTGNSLRNDYGKLSSATAETKKALVRGSKEELVAKVPGINDLNAHDSALMAAHDTTARAVQVGGNANPAGFAMVAHANPKAFLAALIDKTPVLKALIANGLWQAAGAAAGVSPIMIRAAVANIASEGTGNKQQ